jgi:hypothetical protein
MTLAVQTSARPTNKALTMFGGVVVTTPMVLPFVEEVWPQIGPGFLTGPAATYALAAAVAASISLAIAYFVPDQLNYPAGSRDS